VVEALYRNAAAEVHTQRCTLNNQLAQTIIHMSYEHIGVPEAAWSATSARAALRRTAGDSLAQASWLGVRGPIARRLSQSSGCHYLMETVFRL